MGNWQGKKIGRYQVTQLLGQSNGCVVCQAIDEQNQQKVAIKMLPTVPASNRAYLNDVAAQARAVAALEHPHILAIQDFGEQETDNGEVMPYLVTPYVPGGTLAERMQTLKGMLPVYESLRYLRQAARALDYAHHKHVLHRDVRPENMFLRKGWLQLSDFGAVKMISVASHLGSARPEYRTPEYMAPELIEGAEEAASDRYSLAVIAYQMFTGRFPFQGKTSYETLARQVKEQPPEPRQFNTYIPLEVVQVLMRGLAKRPESRPATCAEFLDALEFGWKASGKSDEGPDITWLAPWSKRWTEEEEADEGAESGPLPAQNVQPQIDLSPLQSEAQQPVARAGRKDNLTPFPQPPAGFAQQSLLAHTTTQTRHKDNLTPFPQPPAPVMPDDEPGEFPEFPSWLPEPFRQSTLSKPAQTAQAAPASIGSDHQMSFPEMPTWIPQPFNKATIAQPVQSAQSVQAASVSEPVAGFPELPSWLPQAFQSAQTDQPTEQPVSPVPPILQPDSPVYQETGQSANNVLQKPLSFDSIVRNVIEKQVTGEMPSVTPTIASEPELPNFGGVRKGESFSGVVKGAIAAQQHISPYAPLHEPLVARDNSAKFEAVVKKVMETEPRIASPARQAPMLASVRTPLPGTQLQQTGLQRWERRLQAWIQQIQPYLQRMYQWSRQRALQVYVWSRQITLQVYAWVLQLVNTYGSRSRKDRSTRQ
ncbi:serine/threonine protein kinase [Reticulibacter mediterranei]|nr:serine/threonine-protein kinase [Reticulibacter mediterranei]